MAIPTIAALPTAPQRTDAPATFVTRADAFVAALPTLRTEINAATAATTIDINAAVATVAASTTAAATSATESATSATSSASAATTSTAAANFKGDWSSLIGSIAIGDGVRHNTSFWSALNTIADVTASEPGISADWAVLNQFYKDVRTSNTILGVNDIGKIIEISSGTFSQTLVAAATLQNGWYAFLRVTGSGVITLDPNGAETIDGATTKALTKGSVTLVQCNGTLFTTISYLEFIADDEVVVTTGNGHGSTNNKIRRFSTTQSSVGTAITYADSAADGATFTINTAGLYAITYTDGQSSNPGISHGISVNSAQLTTAISSITAANRLLITSNSQNGVVSSGTIVVLLSATDVIRAHTQGNQDISSVLVSVRIRRIGARQ